MSFPELTVNGTSHQHEFTDETWAIVTRTTLLAVTAILIITGNMLCFMVLLTTRNTNEVMRLCLLSLTATDMGIGFFLCVPITGATAVNRWPYGDAFCQIIAAGTILVSLDGIFVLVVNVERFVSIMWPLRSVIYLTMPRARAAFVVIWLTGGFFAVLYCFLPSRTAEYHPHLHTCLTNPTDHTLTDVMGILAVWIFALIPFLVTLLLYARLYQVARRHARQICVQECGAQPRLGEGESAKLPRRPGIKRSDLKSATTFFIITAVLALSWLPFATVICYEGLTRHEAPPAVTFVAEFLLFSNSYWNIIIYYARNAAFRHATRRFVVVRILRIRGGRSRDNEMEASRAVECVAAKMRVLRPVPIVEMTHHS